MMLVVSSCNLFISLKTRNHIETEGSYVVVSKSIYSSKQGEPTCKVEGNVFDDYTKYPVNYGWVTLLENDQYKAQIDSLGYFNLLLPPGTYKLKFSSAGNKEFITEPIRLNENTRTQLKVYLGSDIMY